jgi:ABC-type transport system involved in multi-copper enzyme maturation permease subunit
VGLVSKEIERRSLYPLLAKPLTRDELYVGKFLGLAFTLLVNTAVMAAGLYLTLLATGRGGDLRLVAAIYSIFLSLLLVVAIAMFFSTMTSIVLSAVSTLGVVIAGRFSDVIRNMKQVAPGAPEWVVKGLYYLIPDFRVFDLKDHAAYGDPIPLSVLGDVTLYAAAYVGLLLAAGVVVFRRKDFQ